MPATGLGEGSDELATHLGQGQEALFHALVVLADLVDLGDA